MSTGVGKQSKPILNPFTPASCTSSVDSEGHQDILSSNVTLEEGLRRSQLRGMKAIEKKFIEVESIYRNIHGEAVSQQGAIESIEDQTLKTALLTGETADELRKAKAKKDRRLRMRIYCISIFLFVLALWLLLVVGLPHND